MSELYAPNQDVTILFHKHDAILIPPLEIPRESRRPGETFEKAYYRLCADHGVAQYIDTVFSIPEEAAGLHRAYLTRARNKELDNSPFFVPLDEIEDHLVRKDIPQLRSDIDKKLVLAARNLLLLR